MAGQCALAIISLLGNGPREVTSESRKPFWLYPNLLSLDAPLVALVWLYIFTKTWRADSPPPWFANVALSLAIWAIYVLDRLLDVSLRGKESDHCQARHRFHDKHRGFFKKAAISATVIAVVLGVARMPFAIYPYFYVIGFLVAGFFGLSLLSSTDSEEIPYAKNILAGLAFAYGTAMTVHVYLPSLGGNTELLKSQEFICFAALCVLNISAIDLWEHANRSPDPEVKAADELALTIPLALLGAASLAFALLDHEMATRPFYYAILTGAALLQILNRTRSRFSMASLRVLADVSMILPLMVFVAFPGG